jgi:AAA domain-containing protein
MTFVPSAVPSDVLNARAAVRLAYFKHKTIAHPHLVQAHERVLQAIREPAGAALIVVYGPSGVGKTTLRLRVQQQLTEAMRVELEEDPGRIAVVGVEAVASESGDFNWRDFYRRALIEVGEPLIDYKVLPRMANDPRSGGRRRVLSERSAAPEFRHALEQALRYRRPAAFVVDEAQHLKKVTSGRRLLDQLDTLKSLASLTGIVHVLIGTYELLALTNLSGQLNRRTIDVHFPRYHADRDEDVECFRRVIFSLQQHLPVFETPDLVSRGDDLYERSVGCVGVLKDWLTRSLAMALERRGGKLTIQDLDGQALNRTKLLQMAREIKEGEDRVAETTRTAEELRRVLGMGTREVGVGSELTEAGQIPSSSVAQRRSSRRRVGERRPTRDVVGTAHAAG